MVQPHQKPRVGGSKRLLYPRAIMIFGIVLALGLFTAALAQNKTSAVGMSSVRDSSTSLTVNLDQCANQATPCSWQNGDLNGNNSSYAEGDVVPFRLAIEGLTAGSHTIHINYDFT